MPRKLHFSGHSDDIVIVVDDRNGEDEFDVWDSTFSASLSDRNGNSLSVFGKYGCGDGGIWMFGICQSGQDVEIPAWPVSFTMAENGYSAVLTIEVPDDAILTTQG